MKRLIACHECSCHYAVELVKRDDSICAHRRLVELSYDGRCSQRAYVELSYDSTINLCHRQSIADPTQRKAVNARKRYERGADESCTDVGALCCEGRTPTLILLQKHVTCVAGEQETAPWCRHTVGTVFKSDCS